VALSALLVAVQMFFGAGAGAQSSTTQATTWQGGPLHDGHTPGEAFAPPLSVAWQATVELASHAVVADGRAYVVSAQSEPYVGYDRPDGNELHAFDVVTGEWLWGPVELGGRASWAGHAYDDGRVYTINGTGILRGHDAVTGAVLWSLDLSMYDYYGPVAPPTAAFGNVYVDGGSGVASLHAVEGATGKPLWSRRTGSGDYSSPVVTAEQVFVTHSCGITWAFRRSDGEQQWLRETGCGGGGGTTSVLHNGLLYVRDLQYSAVLDAATGAVVGPLKVDHAPAFAGGTGYFPLGTSVSARDTHTGAERWRYSGQDRIITPPYVAGGHVYLAGFEGLYALRESDGELVWQADVPADYALEYGQGQPNDGITVAEGTVFVSGGDTLTALRGTSTSQPPSPLPVPLPAPSPTSSPTLSTSPSPSHSSSASPTATASPSTSPPDDGPPAARATDDSCPDGQVPEDGFSDVPASSTHEPAIDCAVWWAVAGGKGDGRYEPGADVTRGQMATFVANTIRRSGGSLPPARADYFADDDGSPHEDNINRLREAGVVAGRSEGRYEPDAGVRRDSMATFLVRNYEFRTGTRLMATRDYFDDDRGSTHEASINKAAEAGFTGGSGSGYDPARTLRRDQLAAFVVRVLDLLVESDHARTP
jgi:outer membrane protein assembly factor BamB